MLPAVAGVDSTQLNWLPAPGASAYWIYRSTNVLSGSTLPDNDLVSVNVPCCTWTDITAPGQTTDYYAVAGANITSLGGYATVNAVPLQGPPSALVATPGWDYTNDQALFNLSWQPPVAISDASTYTIYRANAPGGTTVTVASGISGLSYVDEVVGTPLSTGTPYYYSIQGVNGGASIAVTAAAATAYSPILAVPGGLTVTGQGGGLFVSWQPLPPSTGVSSYFLNLDTTYGAQVMSDLGGALSVTVPASQDSVYLSLTGTSALRQPLVVQLWGHNSAGPGPLTSTASQANNALNGEMPMGVTGTVGFYEAVTGAAQVALSFDTPTSGIMLIYRAQAQTPAAAALLITNCAGGSNNKTYFLTEVDGVDGFVDTSVAVGMNYEYGFTTLHQPGLLGGESPPVLLGPLSPYVAPGPCAISGTAGNGRVDLVFSPPPFWGTNGAPASVTCTAFLLYRQGVSATAGVPTSPSFTAADAGFPISLSLGAVAYTDTDVVNGFAYYYFLKAVDGAGLPSDQWAYPHLLAPYAQDIAPMVPLATQPAPQQLTAVAGDNSVTLRWVATQADADTSAFGGTGGLYNVYRRDLTATPEMAVPGLQGVGPTAGYYSGSTGVEGLDVLTLVDPPSGETGTAGAPANLVPVCYSISTVNSWGESPRSQEVCVTPYNPLNAPTNVSVTVATSNIPGVSRKSLWIGWDGVAGQDAASGGYPVSSYQVLRSANGGDSWVQVGNNVPATSQAAGVPYALTDTTTAYGSSYFYRVVGIDQGGNPGNSSPLVSAVVPTATDAIHLYRNAFDPAKGQSLPVQYSIQQSGHVWVKVFTLSGEYITTLFDENVVGASVANPYLSAKINWPGTNSQGQTVASGVYLIHLEGPDFRANARVAVIK
jgi:hypothetical protein